MNDHRQNQISFLAQSSSVLGKLASITEMDPAAFSEASIGRRVSKRVQQRESDRLSRLLKKSFEDSLVLLTEVYLLSIDLTF
jgi:hypothetical protein